MAIRIKSTQEHKKFWRDRKIDWKAHYLDTWNHPHRALIMWALKSLPWFSIWEVGCGPAPNLLRAYKEIILPEKQAGRPERNIGGSDINPDAIALAKEVFKGGVFQVESIDDMLLSDNAVDLVLSDAALIYFGPRKIHKALAEMTRIGRNYLVLFEFHEKSLWKRLKLRLTTGYNAYDYETLLREHGCYDIRIIKMPKEYWPGAPWEHYGHLIIANISK